MRAVLSDRRNLQHLAAQIGLALIPFVVYARFIFGDELYNPDVFLAYRPAHALLAVGIRDWHVPLWTSAILGGFPIAFSEYGWFSPLTWLPLFALGAHAGYYAAVALSVSLAGLAAYALARTWGATLPAALFAGVVYGQSLFVVGGAPLLNQGAAYWTLPAAMALVESCSRGRGWAAPALGIVVALTLLGSHPQLAVITLVPPAGLAVWRLARGAGSRVFLELAAAGALGVVVSAVRFIPTLSLVAASERAGGLELAASAIGSVPPHALLAGILLPSLQIPRLLSPQWTAYVGSLPLVLALAAGWRQHSALWALAAVGGIVALGSLTPLFWLVQRTPLLSYFREPSRFLLWSILAVALLGAAGLDRSAVRGPSRLRAAAIGCALAGVIPAAGAAVVSLALRANEDRLLTFTYLNTVRGVTQRDYPADHYASLASGAWLALRRAVNPLDPGLLVPLASIAGGAAWWYVWRARAHAAGGAVLCTALPLLAYGQLRLPAVPRAIVAETAAAVAPPETLTVPARVVSWLPLAADFENRVALQGAGLDADVASYRLLKRLLAPNFGLQQGVPQLDGYENLMTREQAVLTAALGSERAVTSSKLALVAQRLPERRRLGGERWGLMEAAGVGTLLTVERLQPSFWPAASVYEPAAIKAERGVPSVTAFRFTHPAPRAYVATTWRISESADAAAQVLFGDEVDGVPATAITVRPGAADALPASRPASFRGGAPGIPTAEIVRDEERVVEVIATSDADALLVLLDANAPGWSATVTGASAPIYTANVAFRAVPIPAGRHLVRFEYRPPGWSAAVAFTAAATVLLGLWSVWVLVPASGRFIRDHPPS